MNIQEALDEPTVHSVHFPSSFYPRSAYPGRMFAESRIPREVIAELERRGHEVVMTDAWANGKVMGIRYDKDRGGHPWGCVGQGQRRLRHRVVALGSNCDVLGENPGDRGVPGATW